MADTLEQKMHRNIRLFGIYKVFTKRVFIALATIYASQVAGLTIAQIGYTTAAAAITGILFETTSGFWADKHGRRNSARVGATLATLGSLCYVLFPHFWGIMAASALLAAGYSFLSGAIEALMHDSLVVLRRESDYAKLASQAQALALFINAGIVAAVPLLYPIDPRLPFIIGVLAYIVLFGLASALTEPLVLHDAEETEKRFLQAVHAVLTRNSVWFFVFGGLAFAFAVGMVDLYNLGYVEIGIAPHYLGFMFGAASIVGAVIGLFVHKLKILTFKQYVLFDLFTQSLVIIALAFIRAIPAVIIAFLITMSLWRYQNIMYQHYLLQIYRSVRYKATLLSLLGNIRQVHEVWIGLLFTRIAQHVGILPATGYGLVLLVLIVPGLLLSIRQLEKSMRASATVSTHTMS